MKRTDISIYRFDNSFEPDGKTFKGQLESLEGKKYLLRIYVEDRFWDITYFTDLQNVKTEKIINDLKELEKDDFKVRYLVILEKKFAYFDIMHPYHRPVINYLEDFFENDITGDYTLHFNSLGRLTGYSWKPSKPDNMV